MDQNKLPVDAGPFRHEGGGPLLTGSGNLRTQGFLSKADLSPTRARDQAGWKMVEFLEVDPKTGTTSVETERAWLLRAYSLPEPIERRIAELRAKGRQMLEEAAAQSVAPHREPMTAAAK